MLGRQRDGILRAGGADIVHMVPPLGAPARLRSTRCGAFSDTALAEKLAASARRRRAGGPAAGTVRFASTVFTYQMTESPEHTRAWRRA